MSSSNAFAEETPIDFGRTIRPILSNACFTCHGPDNARRAADLRLDKEESAKEYAIVEGDPESSEIIARILSDDPDVVMPPPEQAQRPSPEEIELLKKWIAQGAPWSKHWAYIPPKKESPPELQQKDWPQNGIDPFVLTKLEALGLKPNGRASKEMLLRRVTFDLTGLPPTLDEIDAFLRDESPEAYEKVVDRLLASPRYGEHMALPWLAAARYADTNGYQNDATRTMWPWRDWVIRAINDNMPFDQFTVEQIAGDLLEGPQGDGPTRDQMIASGFHRNHGLNGEGGRNPEESRVEYVIDRASTTGSVWLGLTTGCARCHDHKYDDISQKEFYELTAYFNSIDERGGVDAGGNAKPIYALPTETEESEIERTKQQIEEIKRELKKLETPSAEKQIAWEKETQHWLSLLRQDKLWKPLSGVALECENGATWEELSDHSVLVSKMSSTSDDYVITVELPAGNHEALQLEALKHEKLVGGQFSLGINGGFSVTGMIVKLDGKPLSFQEPKANTGEPKGLTDINKYKEWKVEKPTHAPEVPTWMAKFQQPLKLDKPRTLTIRLKHQARTGDAPIGRFRFSVTSYPLPTLKKDLGLSGPVVVALDTPEGKRTEQHRKQLADEARKFAQAPSRKKINELQEHLDWLKWKTTKVMVMCDRQTPRDTYLLKRGLWNQPDKSEKLQPGVMAALPPLPEDAPSNRIALAEWLVRPDHPLTARVTVNRYWQQFFGTGLVKTSEDFGVQGERPSHPALLDWLAIEFVESGWDVKHIHKLIVMSAAYQQDSVATAEAVELDPYNRLISRGPRFRLSSQALRDQALAISGLLVEKMGGPGVMPYQPDKVWSDFSLGKIKYKQGEGDDLYRRSIYTFWRRPVGPTMFFDNPGRQVCTVRPSLTNTPLHALTLLNDVTYVEAARVLAERMLKSPAETAPARIERAFRIATSRFPSKQEIKALESALKKLQDEFQANPEAATELIATGASTADESLDKIDLAAYTSLMNIILNLDEVVTKG
ncbi:MAG: PSD1 and planctomycete cytochrome C domain-containing protein [Lacipirellulaceae bacterium]